MMPVSSRRFNSAETASLTAKGNLLNFCCTGFTSSLILTLCTIFFTQPMAGVGGAVGGGGADGGDGTVGGTDISWTSCSALNITLVPLIAISRALVKSKPSSS